ncbi:uncharacterized protein LOC129796851 [Lutzomyia longipalpis]|uniref:uncharacterized protein LOC129796851 n=1 Tax=Lutzomyia longipalpis TaxID=7200 RepID=UPI0024838059|nr:uncharacterized protein LOC129796851 [Lutzomyia longipalpis]
MFSKTKSTRSFFSNCCTPSSGPTLEDQLRAMQKRLAEIAAIPIQIQATLENVTKTMEKLLPPEQSPEVLSEDESDYGYEEIEQYDDSYRFDQNENEDTASDRTEDAVVDELDDSEDYVEEEQAVVSSASVSEICDNEPESGCVSATPEDRSEGVWSSWPWSEPAKVVPRRSNCHLVPRTSMIKNRIKQLNEKQVLAPYTRNEQNVGN